jgi:hypothetical protein
MAQNHYPIDWRYLTMDTFLAEQLTRPGSVAWEFKTVHQALTRLLKPRRPVSYRFSSQPSPNQNPNPRPF